MEKKYNLNNHLPKIAISLRVVKASNYNEKRDALSQDWTDFFEKIGVFPILVPNHISNVDRFLEEMHVDGIILSGGDNIGDNLERDKTEKTLIEFAIKNKIPLFGVCRGMQVINKFFKGEVNHSKNSNHVAKSHTVEISQPVLEIVKNETVQVNSYHNNILLKNMLGSRLKSFAICKEDQTIEGFYHEEYLISGVMWHPEREQNETNILIVKNFLKKISD